VTQATHTRLLSSPSSLDSVRLGPNGLRAFVVTGTIRHLLSRELALQSSSRMWRFQSFPIAACNRENCQSCTSVKTSEVNHKNAFTRLKNWRETNRYSHNCISHRLRPPFTPHLVLGFRTLLEPPRHSADMSEDHS